MRTIVDARQIPATPNILPKRRCRYRNVACDAKPLPWRIARRSPESAITVTTGRYRALENEYW
jgi:hypothetical protein